MKTFLSVNSKIRSAFFVLVGFLLLSPIATRAVTPVGTPGGSLTPAGTPSASAPSGGGLTNPLNSIDSLPDFLNAILGAVVQLGTIVLTLALIYVGFLFVKAQGKEEEIKNARNALMWTVIGGLVLLGAQTIGMVIASTVESL